MSSYDILVEMASHMNEIVKYLIDK